MKVLVTGSKGFIGKNLCIFLKEKKHEVLEVHRETLKSDIISFIKKADFIIHLAGENRPNDSSKFEVENVQFTNLIVDNLIDLLIWNMAPLDQKLCFQGRPQLK